MYIENTVYSIVLLILTCMSVSASTADTSKVLAQLAANMKSADKLSCVYSMDAKFPNGDKDHFEGTMYINMDKKIYFNECELYTMVYTQSCFIYADHKNKTLSIVDLMKGENKKLRKETEKNIFQNGILITFIDSVLLKKGTVKQLQYAGGKCNVSIGFNGDTRGLKSITVSYDTLTNMPLKCITKVEQPFSTPQGTMKASITATYRDFRHVSDLSKYNENIYFTYEKGKIKLNKYTNYKLIKKM